MALLGNVAYEYVRTANDCEVIHLLAGRLHESFSPVSLPDGSNAIYVEKDILLICVSAHTKT